MRVCLEGMIEKGILVPVYKNGEMQSVYNWPPVRWRLQGMREEER